MEKFPTEGCRVVRDLFQAKWLCSPGSKGALPGFLERFARNRINLDLLTGRQTDDLLVMDCLVSSRDEECARNLIESDPGPGKPAGFRAHVEAISLFPHKADLRTVGLGLLAFAEREIPLHGFCSSLSTLTFVTDPDTSEAALSALRAYFDLPEIIGTASEG